MNRLRLIALWPERCYQDIDGGQCILEGEDCRRNGLDLTRSIGREDAVPISPSKDDALKIDRGG